MADFDPNGATLSPGQFDPNGAVLSPPPPARGMVSKLGSALAGGAKEELAGTFGKTLGLAASALGMAGDEITNTFAGGASTAAQDWAFKNLVDPARAAAERNAATPEEAGSVPLSVARGLGGLGVDLPLIAFTGGKVGLPEGAGVAARALGGMTAMTPVAAAHGISQTETALGQGVDMSTSIASGVTSGMTTMAMGAVPLAMAGGMAKRAITGAVSGAATGEAGRQAQNAVMDDHPELQSHLTPQGVAVNAVTGALLGAAMGPRPIKTEIANARAAAEADVAAGVPVESPLQVQQRTSFMDGIMNAKEAPPRPNEMGPVDQFLMSAGIDRRIAETAPAKPAPQDGPGDAALNAEFGVRDGLDIIGREAQADTAARARIEQAELPRDLPALESVTARNQAHAEDMAILRDAGETPTGDPKLDAARAFALHNDVSPDLQAQFAENFASKIDAAQDAPGKVRTPIDDYLGAKVAPEPVTDRTNTQVADALSDAQRARGAEVAKEQTDAAFEQRADTEAVGKERDLTAIQNIAKGEELAAAAERGDVPMEARLLPASNNEFLNSLKEVTPAEQKLPPKIKQELAQAVKGKDSYEAQLEAIGELRAGKKEGSVSFELLDTLYNKLTEGRELPNAKAQEAAPAEAVQAEAKGPEAPAAGADTAAAKPAEASQRDLSQAAADRLDSMVMGFNERVRAGEKLTPEEQARYDEASELRKVLARALDTNNKGASDAYLKDLSEFADNTATPEAYAAQGPRLARETTVEKIHTDDYNPGVAAAVKASNRVVDLMAHLKENGSEQWVKDLAARLGEMKLKSTIEAVDATSGIPNEVGRYNPTLDRVTVSDGKYGLSEHTVLHEVMHAATYDALDLASVIAKPRNQLEAQQKQAYDGLEKIRVEAKKAATASDHYGLTNVHEFIAELNTNPDFQAFLQQPQHKSLWTKTVDFVAKLLGIPRDGRNSLEKAMSFQDHFFGKQQYELAQVARMQERIFNDSARGAAEVTDASLSRIAAGADEQAKRVDIRSMDRAVFQKLLGWETVQYIADRARALPEMVQSGFSKGVDAYEDAYKARNLANHYAESTAANFASNTQRMLGAMDPARARELNRQMSEIGVGSSIGGFDPTMNFDANLRTRPDLSTSNKAYIDGIYRQFKALERSDPAAAKAIIEGAQVNRKGYVLDAATIIKNLMQHAIDTGTADGALAAQHVAGLDFMAKDVQSAQNGNTKQHIDGASYALDQRIRAAFAAAKTLPEGSLLRTQLAEMQGKYSNAIDNPYYHAGRSGNYFAKIGFKDMDAATWAKMQQALAGTNKVLGDFTNQDHAFFRVDSADQAVGLMNKLVEAGGAKIVMGESARGKLSEGGMISNNAGISAALRSVLGTMHETVDAAQGITGDQAAMMKEAMTRKFLSMLPESSTRLATIKRMGVPGYDGDFLGSFAKRASGGVQDTANIYAMPRYTNAFKGMSEAVNGMTRGGDIDMQARAQMMHDEIAKRYSNGMQPMDSSHVNLINSLGHSFYLALSPAFFIRSMAQPFHRGVPYLGGKFGFVASAKEIGAATGTAMKIMGATIKQGWDDAGARGVLDAHMKFKDMGLTPKEEAFVQEMHDRGALNLGQARQLQRMAMGGSQTRQDLVRFVSMTAQYADMTNRLSTGLAAFRLAEKKGGKTDANTEYAIKAVDLAMDNFDQNNTARQIGRHGIVGKVTPLMTAFMNYNFQTMQQIARTVHDGMFSRDTSPAGVQRGKEARREFAGLMGTTAMISGAMGLPFVTAFAGVYNMLTKDDDDPSDIRQDTRNALSDMFGQEGGNLISNGIGSAVGVDTSTFGLQNLLPGSEFLASRRLMKDRLAETSQGLMGPALNAGMDMAQALSKFSDGQYVKGIEQALPSGMKAFWKAGQLANKGFTDARGNPLGLEADGWDVAVQASGLRPAKRAVQAEAANYFNTNEALRAHRKQVIVDSIYKAVTAGDAEAKAEALGAMREYNQKNPMAPIRDIGSTFRRRATELAVARASGTGVSAGAKKMPLLQDEARFSNSAMPEF